MTPLVLSLVVASAFLLTFYFSSTAEADGERKADPAERLSVAAAPVAPVAPVLASVAPQAVVPMAAASAVNAGAAPAGGLPDAASAPAVTTAEEPSGPAKIETRNDGLAGLPGMAPTVQAVSAQRAAASAAELAGNSPSPAVAPPLPTESTLASRDHVHAAPAAVKPANAKSMAAAKPHETAARPKMQATTAPSTAKSAAVQRSGANDPDAELVAAIMARSSGDTVAGTGHERGSSIAALVRDCNALPDSGSALACRRRICDGYWGKAQACPKSMAPQAAAAVNANTSGTNGTNGTTGTSGTTGINGTTGAAN